MSDSPNASEGIAPAPLGDYLTLAEVTKTLPRVNGQKVHTSTIWRWCRKGVHGVYLKYGKIGRRIMVTESDLHTFFTALAEVDKTSPVPNTVARKRKPRRRTNSAARQREIESANDVLRRAGILTDADVKRSASLLSGGLR